MLPWGTCDSKVPKEPFQRPKLRWKCQCIHQADKLHAGGALHAKEEVGWGGGAHREWCSVGKTGRWGTVVGVCLMPEGGV